MPKILCDSNDCLKFILQVLKSCQILCVHKPSFLLPIGEETKNLVCEKLLAS